MKRKTIRSKIMFSLVMMVILVVILSSMTAFVVTKNHIEKRYLSEFDKMIFSAEYLLASTLSDSSYAVEVAIYQIEQLVKAEGKLTQESVDSILETMKLSVMNATTIFLGTEDQAFYLHPKRFVEQGYDPRVRPWYILAKENPGLVKWSQPYVDMGTQELVITGAKFFEVEGSSIKGSLGVDLRLSDIKNLIDKILLGDSGDLMLVGVDHTVLLSKEETLQNTPLQELAAELLLLENGDRFSTSDYTYFKRTLATDEYYFIGRIKNSELRSLSFATLYAISGMGLALFVVAAFVASFVSKRLTSPLSALSKTMKTVMNGQLETLCEATSNDEVGLLIDGFNDMIENIKENHMEMTALYEELYASEETLKNQYDELYESRETLRESEARYREIFEASKEGLWLLEPDKPIQYLSREWYSNFDIDVDKPSLDRWKQLIYSEDKAVVQRALDQHFRRETPLYTCEFRVLDRQGHYRWIQAVGKASFNSDGNWQRLVGSHVDITQRKESDVRIRNLAYKDMLTGLGNRFALQEFIENELSSGREGALIYIDIDNFKYINDTFGHAIGDVVLKETALRLKQLMVGEVQLARISGDEFAVVLCGAKDRVQVLKYIERILVLLKEDIVIDDRFLNMRVSMGAVFYPLDASDLTDLLKHADLAMFSAKDRSNLEYVFYDDAFKAEVLERIHMENFLKSALSFNEIFVVYQPIVALPSQEVEGFEALMRWSHPSLGLVSPVTFIPLAEKSGVIVSLGYYVLEQSIQFIKRINQGRDKKMQVSVNVSVIQLLHAHFEEEFMSLMKRYDLSKDQIKLEVTESMALEKDPMAIMKLRRLKNQGIQISLDDFGSGYSSINNLLNLPLTTLKIDKDLVHRMVEDPHVSAMVEAVLSYCHLTGIKTVAEGVETLDQLRALVYMGFDAIQGYYYAKPMRPEDIQSFLNQWIHEPLRGE